MQEATFCDWLINRGVEFHPDTVIVDAASIIGWMLNMQLSGTAWTKYDYKDSVVIPPFSFMFVEFKEPMPRALYVEHVATETDFHIYRFTEFTYWGETRYNNPDWTFSNMQEHVHFTRDGYMEAAAGYGIPDKPNSLAIQKPGPVAPMYNGVTLWWNPDIWDRRDENHIFSEHYFQFFFAMVTFHQRKEIELVDYSRQKRRRITRKTGKAPSPYFRILDASDMPQKRYSGSGQSTGRKLDKAHIVRGHFRHTQDHPIAQFNGTFWIPSHMKGKGEKAPPPRYKIVLRDSNATTE